MFERCGDGSGSLDSIVFQGTKYIVSLLFSKYNIEIFNLVVGFKGLGTALHSLYC